MPLWHAFIFFCSILLASCAIYAQVPDAYSYNSIAAFANQLVEQKEYYRAYQEYKRLHAYYADRYAYDNFVVASLYCRYEGKQYNEILTSANFNTITPPWMWIYIFDSAFKRNDSSVDRVIAAVPSYEYSNDINEIIFKRKLAYCFYAGHDYQELSPTQSFVDSYDGESLYAYSRFKRSQLKNPYAALAWGVVPGGGYVYSDNTENGIVAAIVIGICSVITYFAIDTNNTGIAIFTGSIGVFFYGGSIAGGYLASIKTNKAIMSELQAYVEEGLKFHDDRAMMFERYGKPKTQ